MRRFLILCTLAGSLVGCGDPDPVVGNDPGSYGTGGSQTNDPSSAGNPRGSPELKGEAGDNGTP